MDSPVRSRPHVVHDFFDQRWQTHLHPFDTQGKSSSLPVTNPAFTCIHLGSKGETDISASQARAFASMVTLHAELTLPLRAVQTDVAENSPTLRLHGCTR